MATASAAATEAFAKAVLQQRHLFLDLMQVVGKAGEAAVAKKAVQDAANHVCMLPLGVPHLTRRVVPLALQVRHPMPAIPTVSYDARSITIIGGAAVQAYHAYKAVSEYDRPTSDIDAVWWPKIILPTNIRAQLQSDAAEYVSTESPKYKHIYQTHNDPEIHEHEVVHKEPFRYAYSFGGREGRTHVDTTKKNIHLDAAQFAVISSSKAIQTLIVEYTRQLERLMQEYVERNKEDLTDIARDMFESPRGYVFSGAAKFKNLFIAGICNVWGYILIQSTSGRLLGTVKIIEMTIHDGASSQRSDTLEPDTADFIFSRYQPDSAMTKPIGMRFPPFEFRVPYAERLLQQQIRAIQLRTIEPKPDMQKLHSHVLRCRFLYKLLASDTPDAETALQKYRDQFAEICKTNKALDYLCDVDVPIRTTPVVEQVLMSMPSPMALHSPPPLPPTPYMPRTATRTAYRGTATQTRAATQARTMMYAPPLPGTPALAYATMAATPHHQTQSYYWDYVGRQANGQNIYHIRNRATGQHIETRLIRRGGRRTRKNGYSAFSGKRTRRI